MQFDLKELDIELEVRAIANAHYFEFIHNFHSVPDRHAFHELVYVDNGRINVRAENYEGVLEVNQMIIHEPDELHELYCDTDTAPSVIIIGFECTENLAYFSRNIRTLNQPFQMLLAEIIKECRQLFLPPYDVPRTLDMKKRKNRIYGCDQMVKILLEQFFIKLIRSVRNIENKQSVQYSDSLVSEISAYLDINYKQKINIRQLCILFGTNKTTLSYRFKDQTGKTIVEYINGLKIAEAKRLIRIENKSLAQISDELNFNSQHYFTKLFVKSEGCTPTAYSRMIKSKLN